MPQHLHVVAFMGGADLDLRQAQFAAREVTITINAVMGGADIKVNPQTHVIMEGVGILGGYSGPSDSVPAELDRGQPRRPDQGLRDHGRRQRHPQAASAAAGAAARRD